MEKAKVIIGHVTECAVEALFGAFFLQLILSFAISAMWEHIPDLPFKFDFLPVLWDFLKAHEYLSLYLLVLVGLLTRKYCEHYEEGNLNRFVSWINDKNLIEAIFWNAIFAALFLPIYMALKELNFFKIIVSLIVKAFSIPVNEIAGFIFPAAVFDFASWFTRNEYKLCYWVLFVSLILDDLGLPNIKTLVKAGYKKITRSFAKKNTKTKKDAETDW